MSPRRHASDDDSPSEGLADALARWDTAQDWMRTQQESSDQQDQPPPYSGPAPVPNHQAPPPPPHAAQPVWGALPPPAPPGTAAPQQSAELQPPPHQDWSLPAGAALPPPPPAPESWDALLSATSAHSAEETQIMSTPAGGQVPDPRQPPQDKPEPAEPGVAPGGDDPQPEPQAEPAPPQQPEQPPAPEQHPPGQFGVPEQYGQPGQFPPPGAASSLPWEAGLPPAYPQQAQQPQQFQQPQPAPPPQYPPPWGPPPAAEQTWQPPPAYPDPPAQPGGQWQPPPEPPPAPQGPPSQVPAVWQPPPPQPQPPAPMWSGQLPPQPWQQQQQQQQQQPYPQPPPPAQGWIQPGQPSAPSVADLTAQSLLRQRRRPPRTGWRKAVYTLSGHAVNPGESPADLWRRDLMSRAMIPVRGCYRIAVISLKGGVGKTTMTVCLGATLASLRGDRVIAVDANPDRGTLSGKIPLETVATVRNLLNDAEQIQRYSDVRRYTSQSPDRLEVLASESDPAVSTAFSEQDYRVVAGILERFYNVVLTDCGTGLLHSAMAGVLALAQQLVVISSGSVDGARSASATLDWLEAHGHRDMVASSVAVINSVRPKSGGVDLDKLQDHFAARCRAVLRVPYDPHLEEGAEVDLAQLRNETRDALLEMAAAVTDGFPRPSMPGVPQLHGSLPAE